MLAIETKDVWNEANGQITLSKTKPHVVILPTEPSNLAQSVIVTAELEKNVAAKHRHCIDVRPLHEDFRVPVIMGEKPDGMGGYSKFRFVASFIGYAPARDPRLLVAVMVDEPQGDIYGGTVAAPAFEKIVSFALPYLKIPPN